SSGASSSYPSSPTRRSSDLVGLLGAALDITDRKRMEDALRLSEQRNALALEVARLGAWTRWTRTPAGWRSTRARPGSAARRPARSEEHTSELQSRENLVCRL